MAGLPTHPLGSGSALGGVNYDPFFRGAGMEQQRQMFNAGQRESARQRASQELLGKMQAQKNMVLTLAQLKADAEQARMAQEAGAQKMQSAELARQESGARADRELGLREKEIGLREEDRLRDDELKRETFETNAKRKASQARGQASARAALGPNPTDEQIAEAYQKANEFVDDDEARAAFLREIELAETVRARTADAKARADERKTRVAGKASADAGATKARELAGVNPTLDSVAAAAERVMQEFPDDPAAQAAFTQELAKLRGVAELSATRQQKLEMDQREARSKQAQRYADAVQRAGAERAKTTAQRRTDLMLAKADAEAARKIASEVQARVSTGNGNPVELNNAIANMVRYNKRLEEIQNDVAEAERLSGEPERLRWLQGLQNWVQNGGDFPSLPQWIMDAANQ